MSAKWSATKRWRFLFLEVNMAFVNTKTYAELVARVEALEEKLGVGEAAIPNIEHVLSLHDVYGEEYAALLQDKFPTPEAVKAASDEELLGIKGIGQATLSKIRGMS
jgi:ERCC4-type nuclease